MPDSIGTNGLTISTATEINTALTTGFQGIYGADINVDSNSPDGQAIGIFTQENIDLREFLVSVNNSFDPDQAQGALLDQRCAINNVRRIGGTYTVQPVDVTVNATVTLQGLDANYNNPNGTAYTVQDSQGNQYILAETTTITAGLHSLEFRAQKIGAVSVPINTITTPLTIIAGVTTVNNSSAPLTVGVNQESDPALRVRRSRSVANATTGYLNGLLAAILALPGVTEAALYENVTSAVDANGIPAHGIWLVVAGGANSDIGNAIYLRKSYGANMKGSQTFPIVTPSGVEFLAQWDNPTPEPLYILFTIKRTVPGFDFSQDAIKQYMASNSSYEIGQFAETSLITATALNAINSQGGGGVPVLVQISNDNATWTDYLNTATLASEFTVAAANITISVV
jgi:uncharacterized phage protein gp47/JayE